MYVTARATPARRGIDHNAKQKTLLKKLGKTPVEEVSLGFFFRKKESFAKKLNRVTLSTTYVCNMLSICTGNRALPFEQRSVLSGRDAVFAFEEAGKVVAVIKTGLQGGFRDGQFQVLQ